MLLFIAAAILFALSLQLLARPAPGRAGYYLGADGVICITAWKVVEPPARRPSPSRFRSASALAPASGPWGPVAPVHDAGPVTVRPVLVAPVGPALLASPIRFTAQDLAACLEAEPARLTDPIVIPEDVLALFEPCEPALRRAPGEQARRLDRPAFGPGPERLLRATAPSDALH